MASLRDQIRTSGGQLAQTSSEQLAKNVGRTAAPTSPMETGVIGGNPEQAKMAGTPNQTTNALRSAIRGGNDNQSQQLSTQLRQQQYGQQPLTAQQQSAMQRSSQFQRLEGLEQGIESAVSQQIKNITGQDLVTDLGIEDEENKALLERIAAGDTKAVLEYYQKNGMDTSNLTPENIDKIASDLTEKYDIAKGISTTLTGSLADNLNAGTINFDDMGGMEGVAKLLGVSPDKMAGMTIDDLSAAIQGQLQDEYSQVENLQQAANDPFAGPAERAEARKQLRESGAIGIRSIESDMDKLADEMLDDTKISFMGEEMSIEEFLGDENLNGVVANYLDPEKKEFAEELRKENPDLADFIDKHKSVFQEMVKEVSEDVKDFANIQVENKKIANGLPDSVMKEIFPDWGSLQGQKYNADSNNLLAYVNGLSGAIKDNFVANVTSLVNKNPAFAGQLANLTTDQIKQLGLDNPNSDAYQNLSADVEFQSIVDAIPDDAVDTEFLKALFPGQSEEDITSTINSLNAKLKQGFFGVPEGIPADALDENGLIDITKLANLVRNGSINLENGTRPSITSDIMSKASSELTSATSPAYETIANYLTEDGKLPFDKVSKLLDTSSIESLQTLINDEKVWNKLEDGTRSAILNATTNKYVEGKLAEVGLPNYNDISKGIGKSIDEIMGTEQIDTHAGRAYITDTKNKIAELEKIAMGATGKVKEVIDSKINHLKSIVERTTTAIEQNPGYQFENKRNEYQVALKDAFKYPRGTAEFNSAYEKAQELKREAHGIRNNLMKEKVTTKRWNSKTGQYEDVQFYQVHPKYSTVIKNNPL